MIIRLSLRKRVALPVAANAAPFEYQIKRGKYTAWNSRRPIQRFSLGSRENGTPETVQRTSVSSAFVSQLVISLAVGHFWILASIVGILFLLRSSVSSRFNNTPSLALCSQFRVRVFINH